MASLFEHELNTAIVAEPFIPFNLILSGGVRYLIRGPDELIVRDGIIDHYPPSINQHNVLRISKLIAMELIGRS